MGGFEIAWGLSGRLRSDRFGQACVGVRFPMVGRIDLGVRRAVIVVGWWIFDVCSGVPVSGD